MLTLQPSVLTPCPPRVRVATARPGKHAVVGLGHCHSLLDVNCQLKYALLWNGAGSVDSFPEVVNTMRSPSVH